MCNIYQHLICSVIISIACVPVLFQNYLMCYCFLFPLYIHISNTLLLCSYGTNMSVLLKHYHILWLSWLYNHMTSTCRLMLNHDDETALHDSWSQLPYCAAVCIFLFPSFARKVELWILIFKYIWQPAGVPLCTCLRAAFQRLIAVSISLIVRDHSVVFTDHCSFFTHHTLIQSRKKLFAVMFWSLVGLEWNWRACMKKHICFYPEYFCNLWFSFIYSPRSQCVDIPMSDHHGFCKEAVMTMS